MLALAVAPAASCRSSTPLEVALDQRTQGQLSVAAADPGETHAHFGPPDTIRADGRWTYREWRFAGRVHDRITLVRLPNRPYSYGFQPIGSGERTAECRMRHWLAAEGATTLSKVDVGPDKGDCLQLIDARLRNAGKDWPARPD